VAEILDAVERDLAFYGERGGITLSGGEPFAQGAAALELLKVCKARGISTAVETCGCTNLTQLKEAMPYVDLFLWDVKDTDNERHQAYVGAPNTVILENLRAMDALGAKTRLRCILVNGVNTEEKHYRDLAHLASSLRHCEGVDFLPYHAYGGTKSVALGLPDGGKKAWIPTTEEVERAKKIFRET
jgi:pyruvate formate lyase activating enzyme